jgi:Tol biopolymer transport system component
LAALGGTDDALAATIFNPDTGTSVALHAPVPGMNFGCNVWTADAKRLACDSFAGEPSDRNGIYTLRVADGQGLTRVTSYPEGEDSPESYSPDGARLEFVRFNEDGPVGLFVVNANGTGLKRITPQGMLIDGDRFGDWSPQGNTIVFAAHADDSVRNSIWMVHADGTGLHQVPLAATPACGGSFDDPTSRGCFDATFSPDGKKIAFIVNDPATTGESVYSANVDGSDVTLVTLADAENPDWGTHPLD